MNNLIRRIDAYRIPIRERLNPYFGGGRKRKLDNPNFTIFSNNCWGGHVYRYFNMPYLSPTVGLYFMGDDYVKFVSDLERYCGCEPQMIKAEESHNFERLKEQGNTKVPIGLLDNEVEVVFLHNHSDEEAKEKWMRRCERICWDNIILKFSEQNYVTPNQLKIVDQLPFDKKVIFTSHDYGLKSQVIYREWEGYDQIPDETTHFRKYVNIINLLNGKPFKKRQ